MSEHTRRLSSKAIESYRQRIAIGDRLEGLSAKVEFPLGELIDSLMGFAWAWKIAGKDLSAQPIMAADRFNAQGLEGKVSLGMDLSSAIVVYSQCGPNRCQIFV